MDQMDWPQQAILCPSYLQVSLWQGYSAYVPPLFILLLIFLSLILGKNASLTSLLTMLRSFPSVLVFHGKLQLSPTVAMELCCVCGALLAFLMMIFRAMRCTLTFAVLWFFYLSIYKVYTYCVVHECIFTNHLLCIVISGWSSVPVVSVVSTCSYLIAECISMRQLTIQAGWDFMLCTCVCM